MYIVHVEYKGKSIATTQHSSKLDKAISLAQLVSTQLPATMSVTVRHHKREEEVYHRIDGELA